MAQLDKLPAFIAARRRNFALPARRPARPARSSSSCPRRRRAREPSWFGFPLAVRAGRAVRRATQSIRAPGERARSRRGCCSAATCCASRPTATCAHRVVGDPDEHRLRDEPGVLDRRLSRPDAADDRLRARGLARSGALVRVLVTGASGHVGSFVVRRLLRDGHVVIAGVRSSSDLWRLDDIVDAAELLPFDLAAFTACLTRSPRRDPMWSSTPPGRASVPRTGMIRATWLRTSRGLSSSSDRQARPARVSS